MNIDKRHGPKGQLTDLMAVASNLDLVIYCDSLRERVNASV
jgi:hypothetical protein